jgi:Tol biopolymer transport system component
MNPSLSPAGDRVAYTRAATSGDTCVWISSLAGGPPVRLTNSSCAGNEFAGAWSPDGTRFVYLHGDGSIMIAKTSGQATPVELRAKIIPSLPAWSPTGDWISFQDASGWNLISPDGKSTRSLGKIDTYHLAFSKDGNILYGIRNEGDHRFLFSLPIATGQMKTIGDVGTEFQPRTYVGPGFRFSVSPDGESILYATGTHQEGLWMLEGFAR